MKKYYHESPSGYNYTMFDIEMVNILSEVRTKVSETGISATLQDHQYNMCSDSTRVIITGPNVGGKGIHVIEKNFKWFKKLAVRGKDNKSWFVRTERFNLP